MKNLQMDETMIFLKRKINFSLYYMLSIILFFILIFFMFNNQNKELREKLDIVKKLKIYILSLKVRQDRRTRITKSINNDERYEIIIFDAIDGNTLKEKNSKLTKGEIGCFLSHCNVWNIKNNDDFFMVLEDDANIILPEMFDSINTIISNTPLDWDIIFLGYNYIRDDKEILPNDIIKIKYAYGTHAMLIKSSCAKKLQELTKDYINGTKNIETPIDVWIWNQNLNIYGPSISLINQDDFGNSNTQKIR